MNTTAHGPTQQQGGDPPDDDVFAGEFVLGVLDARNRAEAVRRIGDEPVFARRVAAWERHFEPWLEEIAAGDVPAHLWPRIRQRLGWPSVEPVRTGVWNSAAFWRGATALAAAAALAALYVGRGPEPRVPPKTPSVVVKPPAPQAVPEAAARPVTVLAREDGATAWIATVAASRESVLMVPVPSPADPAGRVDELWIIPAGAAPISLGFVSNEKAHTIAIPASLRDTIAVGATFAVSLEPRAGIPHAAPSGPILATGQLTAI
jgi:anti-sigma-K factor RskA